MLVDVDNFYDLREVSDGSAFASVLMRVIRDFLAVCDHEVDQLLIRLYGGWYEGVSMTSRASQLAQIAADGDPFPLTHGGRSVAGRVELASGPIHTPGVVLPHTHRVRETAPRLRRTPGADEPSCCSDSACSARKLARWSEGPQKICPTEGCTVPYSRAFFGREQKMVDTMIAIDLIELTVSQRIGSVALISDDTDFVPALLYAGQKSTGQVVSFRKRRMDPMLERLLDHAGVLPIGLV